MEQRERIAKRYHHPGVNAAACIAKSVAGIAIIGLIGVIGVSFNENGVEDRANAQMNDSRLRAEASQQNVPAAHMQQTDVEASGGAQSAQRTAYRSSR